MVLIHSFLSMEEKVLFLPFFVKIEKFNLDDAGLNGIVFQKYFSTESFLSIHNFFGGCVKKFEKSIFWDTLFRIFDLISVLKKKPSIPVGLGLHIKALYSLDRLI